MDDTDFKNLYKNYLYRFEKLFGNQEIDSVVKFRETLIQKMDYCDFVDTLQKCKTLESYIASERTPIIELFRAYEELCAKMLERPKDSMTL